MKILLFGEFSGLFTCLYHGLKKIGHDVYFVSDGNGFKDYHADFRYDAHLFKKRNLLTTPFEVANLWLHRDKLCGYDIVFFVDSSVISRHPQWNAPLYRYMIKHNRASFLCGAGDMAIMVDYWHNSHDKYKYYVDGIIEGSKNKGTVSLLDNKELRAWEDELLNSVDGYIPIWYEYAQPFRNYKTILPTVRIPINWEDFEYVPNRVKDKIVFFHGVPTRPEAKGTALIKEAFIRMEKRYSKIAEFHCAGGLPFNEYMDIVSRTNVILDDANSYSVAMNGLFSMAKGKIVMGGAEPEGNIELGIENVNPVINLKHDIDQICSQIEYIINNKDKIEEWGYNSRKFVETYHDSIDIAKQYEMIFKKCLREKYNE